MLGLPLFCGVLGRVRDGDFGWSYGWIVRVCLFFNTGRRADLAAAVAEVDVADTALEGHNAFESLKNVAV